MIYIAFMIGLSGSLHCLGMCGPIAMALPVHTNDPWIKVLKYLLYNLGRVITYAILGLLIGVAGKGLALAGFQQFLSIACGILIIASVLLIYNPFHFKWGHNAVSKIIKSKIQSGFQYYLRKTGFFSLFVLGLLNGLLPCGLVYMAMLGALTTGDALSGAAFMAAFGMGTVPLMLAISLTGNMISVKWRLVFMKGVPVIGCVVGVLLIMRGFNVPIPFQGAGHSCCQIPHAH